MHNQWVSHYFDLRKYPKLRQVKIIWVSATPENCSLIKNVKAKDVFVLPNHPDYRNEIKFYEWAGELESVKNEVTRINNLKNGEIILYCSERLKEGQLQVSKELFSLMQCAVITYNGDGIISYVPGRESVQHFIPISMVINIVSIEYSGAIIIVGQAMMGRGISFVGTCPVGGKPPTATVMFYEGSKTAHAVAIAQRIGRLSGKSRPELHERRLYCSTPIYECCTGYLSNQIAIYETLRKPENRERLVADIFKQPIPGTVALNRKVDNPNLAKVVKIYNDASSSNSSAVAGPSRNVASDEGKIKSLVRCWGDESNQDDIAIMFRKIHSMPGHKLLSSEVERGFQTYGPLGVMTQPNHARRWCLVFSKDATHHYINPEAVLLATTLL